MKKLEWSQGFPHYNPMGVSCCHGNQSSDPILPNGAKKRKALMLMQPIPNPNDAPYEICLLSASWSQRYIHVLKCEHIDAWTDGRWLESHPINSSWAFGSGELKNVLIFDPILRVAGVYGQNICLHVAACIIVFTVICNMTIVWKGLILASTPPLSSPRGPDPGLQM